MKDQDRTRTGGRRLRHGALAAALLAAVSVGHGAARAQTETDPGAGTMFVGCTEQAWADYNRCLVRARSEFGRVFCDMAFQADLVWCGSVYKRQVETGLR